MTPAERILERLDGVEYTGGNEYKARCPAHDDGTASLSIKESDDGTVLLHCFAGCETPAVVAAAGLELKDLYEPRDNPAPRPSRAKPLSRPLKIKPLTDDETKKVEERLDALEESSEALGEVERRGLTGSSIVAGTLRNNFKTKDGKVLAKAGALLLEITGPDGKPWATKARNIGSSEELAAAGLERYVYTTPGHGSPAWCSPEYGTRESLLIVEGELNGAVAHLALERAGLSYGVQGVAGAKSMPHTEGIKGREVMLYADGDDAGRKAVAAWAAFALEHGAVGVWVLEALTYPEDFCDRHATLGEWLLDALENAVEWSPLSTDQADEKKPEKGKESRESQSDRLVQLAENADLWHTPDGEGFADLTIDNRRETHAIRGKAFKQWLAFEFYNAEQKTAGAQAVQDALSTLEGKARFEGDEHEVFVRIAHTDIEGDHRVYLDLGREDWAAVEITRDGWQIVQHPPVRFRRPKSLRPLPEPVLGGNVNELRDVLNIAQNSWVLLVAWLVACFSRGPFPVVLFVAEAGSGKTTTAERVRELIDPAKGGLRAEPREVRDLMIAASNSHIPAFDNLSSVPVWLSDALCRLATGGGFSTRELYSNDEEVILDVTRPCLLTGIEDLATRGDLLDRALIVRLEPIKPDARKTRNQLDSSFEVAHPRVLGALLAAASQALRDEKTVKLATLPRMADFAVWVAAAAPALGFTADEFMEAYTLNREDANATAIEASPLAGVLRGWLGKNKFDGTIGNLLHELNTSIADEDAKRSRGWPKTAKALAGGLRRIGPNLRGIGFTVEFGPRTEKGVTIKLEKRAAAESGKDNAAELEKTWETSTGSTGSTSSRAGQLSEPERSLNVDVQPDRNVQDSMLEPEHAGVDVQERTANVQAENTVQHAEMNVMNIMHVKTLPVLNDEMLEAEL